MEALTFDQLPKAISELLEKVSRIEERLNEHGQENHSDERLIGIKQAAEILNLAISTVYSKVCRREIPVSKQGKKLYFLKAELLEWVKSGKKRTVDEVRENVVMSLRRKSK